MATTPSGTFTTLPGSPESTIRGGSGSDVLANLNLASNVRLESLGAADQLHIKAKDSSTVFDAIKAYSGDGADSITTHNTTTNSLLQGGRGGDTILIGSQITNTTVRGGTANDTITANLGSTSAIINGNNNIDNIFIGNTHNSSSIHGGAENDTITLVDGILNNSSISGDKGNDTITDQGAGISFAMNGNSGVFGNDGADNITLTTVRTNVIAQGGAGNDTIQGGTVDDTLTGGADADEIEGFNGADTLAGSAGADTIEGGNGIDSITGGTEADTIKYETLALFLDGNAVVDTVDGGTGDDTIEIGAAVNIAAADVLTRTDNVEIIKQTAAGASTIDVTTAARLSDITQFDGSANTAKNTWDFNTIATAMTLKGGTIADDITGGSGADTVTGNNGNDTITGHDGSDDLDGGGGDDTFIYLVEANIDSDVIKGAAGTNTVNVAALDAAFDFSNTTVTNIDIVSGMSLNLGGTADITKLMGDVNTSVVVDEGGANTTITGFKAATAQTLDLGALTNTNWQGAAEVNAAAVTEKGEWSLVGAVLHFWNEVGNAAQSVTLTGAGAGDVTATGGNEVFTITI